MDVLSGKTFVFFQRNTGREFFQFYWTAAIILLFKTGLSYMSLKLGTVLIGLITLIYVYLLGKEMGNQRTGLLALRLILQRAVRTRLLASNPMDAVEWRGTQRIDKVDPFTAAELRAALLAAEKVDDTFALMLRVWAQSGMRAGEVSALQARDFDLKRGEAFGFLGPNGAGKTSTMRMIGCVSPETEGTLRVLGLDPAKDGSKIRARLGVVPQLDTLDMELTVRENVIIYGRYFGLSRRDLAHRADELLEFVQLNERANDRVEPLSGGMKRRLTIARSLINDPEVLLLDEPTTGLDPRSRSQVWELVRRIAAEGTTVLLTTQYLDEADRLAERLAVVDHGRVIAEGTSRELKASVGSNALHVRLASAEQRALAQQVVERVLGDGVLPVTEPLEVAARLESPAQAAMILAALIESRVEVAQFAVGSPSLDEVFLALTGRPAEDATPVAERAP